MSIKRAKTRNPGADRGGEDDGSYFSKPKGPDKTWAEQIADKADDAFAKYAISARFTKGALVMHPKFGKGIVVAVDSNRVEVLFEEGVKKLGHGQAAG